MTLLLILIHAFSRNPQFRPDVLYFGTVVIDLAILALLENML